MDGNARHTPPPMLPDISDNTVLLPEGFRLMSNVNINQHNFLLATPT
jgi:hypothetical protein